MDGDGQLIPGLCPSLQWLRKPSPSGQMHSLVILDPRKAKSCIRHHGMMVGPTKCQILELSLGKRLIDISKNLLWLKSAQNYLIKKFT